MSTGLKRISPTTELVLPPRYTPAEMRQMAAEVAKSGFYKMTIEQVCTLMMLAESKGMHPMTAMERYHVFNGRPSMRSDAMLAEFQRNGGWIEWTKDTDLVCEAVFYHEKYCKEGHTVSFTMADAKRAGLDGKDVWRAHPRPMLRSRVITNGVRMILPGCIMGIYTPDEIEEFTPGPAPREHQAQASLTARLKERQAPTRTNGHQPEPEAPANGHDVAEVVGAMKAHEEAQRPPAEPKSDLSLWVEQTLASFNLAYVKAVPGAKAVHRAQIANHVIKTAVAAGLTNELLITDATGKPDSRAKGREFQRLWNMDAEWVTKEVVDYLDAMLPAQEEDAEADADEAMDAMDDGMPKKAG